MSSLSQFVHERNCRRHQFHQLPHEPLIIPFLFIIIFTIRGFHIQLQISVLPLPKAKCSTYICPVGRAVSPFFIFSACPFCTPFIHQQISTPIQILRVPFPLHCCTLAWAGSEVIYRLRRLRYVGGKSSDLPLFMKICGQIFELDLCLGNYLNFREIKCGKGLA